MVMTKDPELDPGMVSVFVAAEAVVPVPGLKVQLPGAVPAQVMVFATRLVPPT
jgi:hypothetical protein